MPGYLINLAQQLAGEQEEVLKEFQPLLQNMEHIKDIVAMQQSYAKISGVVETVRVADLVEDALSMNAGALVRHRKCRSFANTTDPAGHRREAQGAANPGERDPQRQIRL